MYLLFIQFLLLLYGVYENKKAIEVGSNYSLIQEYYFLSAIRDLENMLVSKEIPISKGIYTFLHGEVHYTINQSSPEGYKIEYKLYLLDNEAIHGTSYFNNEQNKMVKWVEIN